jgi:hypothetical protein
MKKNDSNLNLKSNIMIKSRYAGKPSWWEYAPADLLIKLFPEYRDTRADRFLTPQQINQKKRLLFLADKIVDID